MTPDGFLSLIALIVAALGFLPAVRRLHLRATLRRSVIVTVPAFFAVLYFEFFAAAQLPCPELLGPVCEVFEMRDKGPFGPRDAAFAIVLVWAAIMWLIHQGETIAAGSLPALKAIAIELAQARDHSTLVDLVEPHLALIDRVERRQLRRQRLYDWWASRRAPRPPDFQLLLFGQEPRVERESRLRSLRFRLRRMSGLPGLMLPSGRRIEEAARWLRDRLLTDVGLRRHLVDRRPAFGARLMILPGHLAGDFASKFLTDMAADTSSSLYREIEQWGGADPWAPRHFDEHYPLLGALLNDASVADEVGAYRPVAEHFLSRIRPANDPAYVASLNLRPDRLWDEVGRHQDTAFVTVQFFDLMVTQAAYQGVESHMWLMYTDHFVDALLEIHDETGPGVDPTSEWPTRGSEILYRIVDALRRWIKLHRRLPEGSWHRGVEHANLRSGEGRIPLSAVISLSRIVQAILLGPQVGDEFKTYVMEIAVRCVRDLSLKGNDKIFHDLLVEGLAGGAALARREEFTAAAWYHYRNLDHVLRMATPGLEAALKAAVPAPRPDPPAPVPPLLPAAQASRLERFLGLFRRSGR